MATFDYGRINRLCRLFARGCALCVGLGAQTRAQRTDSTATITGAVYDSIARKPVVGATVQLVSVGTALPFSRGAETDSSGRFALTSIPAGEYAIAFVHPTLDSLGLEPPAYRVSARAGMTTSVTLAVPSPGRLHDVICGARPKTDSTGVVIGHLYDAVTRRGIEKARVTVRWLELTISSTGMARAFPLRVDTTAGNGWFAICNVPLLTHVGVQAIRGQDSTTELDVEMPASRLVRQDLYIGGSELVLLPSPDSAGVPDSLRLPATYVHRGNVRLNGVVKRADSNMPLRGASVTIAGSGIVATTDDVGRFALDRLPGGTQTLETRAVGFLPDRRVVNLLGDPSVPLEITLPTLKSVLDTVRITATRIYSADTHGFERRRKTGFGRFFGAEDVARYHPLATSSLLRTIPSVRIGYGSDGPILMRGDLRYCSPLVFIDGLRLDGATAADIDSWVQPEEIDGMEVYARSTQVPPQFSSLTGCGAIVIWRRPPTKRR